MVVALHDGEISTSVMFAIVKGHGVWGVSVMCVMRGAAQVYLLAVVLCESAAIVCPFPVSATGGLLLWVL